MNNSDATNTTECGDIRTYSIASGTAYIRLHAALPSSVPTEMPLSAHGRRLADLWVHARADVIRQLSFVRRYVLHAILTCHPHPAQRCGMGRLAGGDGDDHQ